MQKPGEDPAEEILAGELAGDLVQRLLRRAQLLGHELAGAPLGELTRRLLGVRPGARQRLQVPAAGRRSPRLHAPVAHALLQVRTQRIDPGPVSAET